MDIFLGGGSVPRSHVVVEAIHFTVIMDRGHTRLVFRTIVTVNLGLSTAI